MTVHLLGHEARRAGPAALALPLLAAGGIAADAVAANSHGTSAQTAGLTLVRLVADVLPVSAGLAAAAVVGRERLMELQLSVPTPYPVTVRRRLLLLAGVVLGAVVGVLSVLGATGQWVHPAHGPLALLVPGGPAMLLAGVGAWAAARWQSVAAASTTVLTAWLAQLVVWDRFVGMWQANRLILVAAGAGLLIAALRSLFDAERLLAADRQVEQ